MLTWIECLHPSAFLQLKNKTKFQDVFEIFQPFLIYKNQIKFSAYVRCAQEPFKSNSRSIVSICIITFCRFRKNTGNLILEDKGPSGNCEQGIEVKYCWNILANSHC